MASSLFDLTGQTALITGGHRGIGYAIAEEMALCGAKVVLSSEDEAGCLKAADTLCDRGLKAVGIRCDVTVDVDITALVNAAEAACGPITILVSNAGIGQSFGSMIDLDDGEYARIMNLNLRGPLKLCQAVIPSMVKNGGGSVILMSSLSGLRGNRVIGAYALSKAALAQMARNLAVEFGPHHIRVNAISPGLIATEFSTSMMADPDKLQVRLDKTPLRRMGEAREIAGAAVFLAAPAGAFVSGHNLVVDGGTLITD